jgi:hypothetical protein
MQRELRIVLNGSSAPDKLQNCRIATSVDTTGMACPYPSFESVKAMSLLNDTDDAKNRPLNQYQAFVKNGSGNS